MINQIYKIFKNQGLRYVTFRMQYELKRKFGLLKKSYPINPKQRSYLTLSNWKRLKIPFIISERSTIDVAKNPSDTLLQNYTKIRSGQIKYFNREWKQVDDWLTNSDSGYRYDISNHWTEIEDISEKAGDIKYVWEKSRFSYLYDIVRYDHHFDEDSAEFVFAEIDSWIKANPINMGPNYKCSQETSLRCLNWIFAMNFYQESKALTEVRWQNIIHFIHWQIKHVYENIDFSKICVRNNHAITECLMIYFGGLLFPFFDEAPKWRKEGKAWLEKEIAYQVYEDGTFLQFSHNYQRVLVQLLTWIIALSKAHKDTLSPTTISRASSILNYMSRCCIGKEGQLPNYGSNDGALFFNFNDQDYSDFRPQLNALAAVLGFNTPYELPSVLEDAQWMCQSIERSKTSLFDVIVAVKSYTEGGIYTVKDGSSFTFLKCTSYKDRPAHADNMHLDIWVNGENYFRDSGTYKYNTEEKLINYFAGTAGHNTVMIDDLNQMTKGPRFIWYDWTKESECYVKETEDVFQIESLAKMYPSEGKYISLKRTVLKKKSSLEWTIIDTVSSKRASAEMRQLWHPNPKLLTNIKVTAYDEDDNEIGKTESTGFWSGYYGSKETVPVWEYKTKGNYIKTKIEIKP